jgi:RNA polymerase sigma factor (TIGR02999 family)
MWRLRVCGGKLVLKERARDSMAADQTASSEELFQRWRSGDSAALQQLLPLVYEELRRVARHQLRGERRDHTLQTTALVHEAYLRLTRGSHDVRDRTHFIALSSRMMRQILVDYARARLTDKRGGGSRVTLAGNIAADATDEVDVIAIDAALERLALLDEQQARVVELRYFGGLSIAETAQALDVSAATVKREWATARLWLHSHMQHSEAQ